MWNKVSCLSKQHDGSDQAQIPDLQIRSPLDHCASTSRKYDLLNFLFLILTLSGKSSKVVLTASFEPNFGALYLLTMSVSVAETMKYCCFKRNSFPSKN